MQKKCRSLLINAIAHERMTPLHQIIGISSNIIQKNKRNKFSQELQFQISGRGSRGSF
jgi:hypothetical protein